MKNCRWGELYSVDICCIWRSTDAVRIHNSVDSLSAGFPAVLKEKVWRKSAARRLPMRSRLCKGGSCDVRPACSSVRIVCVFRDSMTVFSRDFVRWSLRTGGREIVGLHRRSP